MSDISISLHAVIETAPASDDLLARTLSYFQTAHSLKAAEVTWKFWGVWLVRSEKDLRDIRPPIIAVPRFELPSGTEEIAKAIKGLREECTRQWGPGEFEFRFDLLSPLGRCEVTRAVQGTAAFGIELNPKTGNVTSEGPELLEHQELEQILIWTDPKADSTHFPVTVRGLSHAIGNALGQKLGASRYVLYFSGSQVSVLDYLKVLEHLAISEFKVDLHNSDSRFPGDKMVFFNTQRTDPAALADLEKSGRLASARAKSPATRARFYPDLKSIRIDFQDWAEIHKILEGLRLAR